MVININPNRINTANTASSIARKAAERKRQQGEANSEIPTPKKAHVNIIPSPESLATLVRSAVEALRRGKGWDRGTIVNLLV